MACIDMILNIVYYMYRDGHKDREREKIKENNEACDINHCKYIVIILV